MIPTSLRAIPRVFVLNFMLGNREGSFERGLGQVAAIWILDA